MRCGVKIVSLSNGFTRGEREREREQGGREGKSERGREKEKRDIQKKMLKIQNTNRTSNPCKINSEGKSKSNFEPLKIIPKLEFELRTSQK